MTRRPRRPPARGWSAIVVFGLWFILPAMALPISGEGASPTSGAGCTPGSGLSLNVTPSSGPARLTVTFAISDPHGPPTWVNWTFGDGTPPADGQGNPYLSTNHRYTAWGLFEAVVNVSQGSGSLLCAAAIEVNPPAFSVTVHATPMSGTAPLTVRFSVNISGGTTTYPEAQWSFGDGSTATGFNVSYTYSAPGTYAASLLVIDDAGQSAQDQVMIEVNDSATVSHPPGSGGNGGLPFWVMGAIAGVALALGLGLVLWWRWGTRGRSEPPTSALGGADDEGEGGPRTGPDGPGSVASGPGESAPTFVELVRAPTVRNEPSGAPTENAATLQADRSNGDLDSAELSNLGVEVPPISTSAPPEPRLKLSQRVMLHLYLQGHLADGEVAPMGFTQGGMADKLAAAQSPLSSVLRRLVVAGLVTQDTRHVRGQPRRLRVYRLTSVGEVVARDLYRDSLAEDRAGPNVD